MTYRKGCIIHWPPGAPGLQLDSLAMQTWKIRRALSRVRISYDRLRSFRRSIVTWSSRAIGRLDMLLL